MLSRWAVYRARRKTGHRRRAAWAEAGLIVRRRKDLLGRIPGTGMGRGGR